MSTCSKSIADSTIPKASGKLIFIKAGKTQDIIDTILKEDKRAHTYTKDFAPHLKLKSVYETCRNIWSFVKCNIAYELDPIGVQMIKTPAQTWADKKADCKSYSLFVASCLKNLGIPYSFRFTSYKSNDPDPTHVYIVAYDKGREIIIDGVLGAFDKEKSFKHKIDYRMTKIYVVQGPPQEQEGRLVLTKPVDEITDGEMTLLIAKQALEIDKMNFLKAAERAKVEGIGSAASKYELKAAHVEDQLDVIKDALEVVNDPNLSDEEKQAMLSGIADDSAEGLYGICCNGQINGPADREMHRRNRRAGIRARMEARRRNPHYVGAIGKTILGKFLQKVGKGVASVAKAVVKVVTAPAKLAVKGILEILIPKSAPFFLYLFVTDGNIIAKLPPKVKAKRAKAEAIANFIVNVIGMKRDHFMGLVRNGITKRYGNSPEGVLAQQLKGIAGIGVLPAVVITGLFELLSKIFSVFGKKPEVPVSEADAPAEDDWAGYLAESERQTLANDINKQQDDFDESGGRRRRGIC